MKILYLDDHPVMHLVMRTLVSSALPDAEVVDVGELEQALVILREQPMDIALIEHGVSGYRKLDVLERVRQAQPDVRIVFFSAADDPGTINAALDAGASGYIPKTTQLKVIVAALRLIAEGGVYIPPEARSRTEAGGGVSGSVTYRRRIDRLTDRQREVLALVARGFNNRKIASTLNVSESTVKQHVHSIFVLLGVSSRTQASSYAVRDPGLEYRESSGT